MSGRVPSPELYSIIWIPLFPVLLVKITVEKLTRTIFFMWSIEKLSYICCVSSIWEECVEWDSVVEVEPDMKLCYEKGFSSLSFL